MHIWIHIQYNQIESKEEWRICTRIYDNNFKWMEVIIRFWGENEHILRLIKNMEEKDFGKFPTNGQFDLLIHFIIS